MISMKKFPVLTAALFLFPILIAHSQEFQRLEPESTEIIQTAESRIRIMCGLKNAGVYINEDFYGYTPLEIDRLIPGFYQISIRKDGFRNNDKEIFIENGLLKNYFFEMEPEYGFLCLTGIPEDSIITLDGKRLDDGSPSFTDNERKKRWQIQSGSHILKIQAFGMETINRKIEIVPDSETGFTPDFTEKQLVLKQFKARTGKISLSKIMGKKEIGFSFFISKNADVKISIEDESGKTVAEGNFTSFSTEKQKAVLILDDEETAGITAGKYKARIQADDGKNILFDECSFSVRVDN